MNNSNEHKFNIKLLKKLKIINITSNKIMPSRKIWVKKMIRYMEEDEENRRKYFKVNIDTIKLAKYKRENSSLKNRLEITFKSLTDKIDERNRERRLKS